MKLKKSIVKDILNTSDISSFPPFCIIKDDGRDLVTLEPHTSYVIVMGAPKLSNSLDIKKREAKDIINKFHLLPYDKGKDGCIYDTDGQRYRNRYRFHSVTI